MPEFSGPLAIEEIPTPVHGEDDALIKVSACGICRSDHHIWKGHYDIELPVTLGHEISGTVERVGKNVTKFAPGDRVVVTMCGGCGSCNWCIEGRHHSCDDPYQPGYNTPGGFAEYTVVKQANINMERIPDNIDFASAAALGCRYITAYHGVIEVGRLKAGDWLAIHGCGGVGLSAVQIARACGGLVIAVDIDDKKLELCKELGADYLINSRHEDPVRRIKEITGGGASLSLDALGLKETCQNSVRCLRKHGRHVQIGIAAEVDIALPVNDIMSGEIEILGSHGMPISSFRGLLNLVESGRLSPGSLISEIVSLEDVERVLKGMDNHEALGVTVAKVCSD